MYGAAEATSYELFNIAKCQKDWQYWKTNKRWQEKEKQKKKKIGELILKAKMFLQVMQKYLAKQKNNYICNW